jgi:uridylate kinase
MFDEGVFAIFNEDKKGEAESNIESAYDGGSSTSSHSSYSGDDFKGKIFVLSLGGSVLIREKLNTAQISKICHLVDSLRKEGYRFVLVIGGGKTARDYVAGGKALGANNFALDELGIAASRLNAKLVIQALENPVHEVMTDVNKALGALEKNAVPVYGGLIPGFTTDTVASLLSEVLGATFINLSNVDGVYSANPKENSDAKFYATLSHEELIKIIGRSTGWGASPSQNVVLDLPCALILKRSNIKSVVLNAEDVDNLENAIRGREFKGTIIESEETEVD